MDIKHYKINKNTIKRLYEMLSKVTSLFELKNIEYWVDGGTLLGAVRHSGIIPWDDDLDISIQYKNRNKIIKLEKELNKLGFGLVESYFGFKIYYLDGDLIKHNRWTEHKRIFKEKNPNIRSRKDISKYASKTYKKKKEIEYKKYKYPYMDIFFTKIVKDKVVYLKNRWNNCFYFKKDLFPLKKYNFYNFKVDGPNKPKLYLYNCYKKNWNDIGIISYNHKLEKLIKPVKFKLSNKTRKYAKFN